MKTLPDRLAGLLNGLACGYTGAGLFTGRAMGLHSEINFEIEICEHLRAHGWLYAEGDHATYDRARALFPEDVIAWVNQTQSDHWARKV